MRTLLPLLLMASACGPIQPCLDQCEDDNAFFEACMGDDGTLCDGGVAVDCVDDVEAMVDCYEAWADGGECDWEQLMADGAVHYCESADELLASCKAVARERMAREDQEGKQERSEQCQAEPSSAFEIAIDEQDCAAVCEQLGLPTALEPGTGDRVRLGRHSAVPLSTW
jgi:hypothetical protein